MLDGLYPFGLEMTQTDGSKTPTDHALFADMANLREKLMKLQVEEPMFPSFFESGVVQLPPPGLAIDLKAPAQDAGADLGSELKRFLCGQETKAPAAPTGPSGHVVSVGSVGHPFSCAEACKYVKRKGGCRDGSQCTKCHECFWSRVPAGLREKEDPKPAESVETVQVQEAQPFSAGSVGHPYTCANACKYVWRKRGCRDGANCPNCHYCKWQRKSKDEDEEEEDSVQTPTSSVTPALGNIRPPPGLEPPSTSPSTSGMQIQAPGLLSSVGSLGHPYSCAQACKYIGKAKGCKDGTNCPNCHLCRWSRNACTKVIHL
ncbi:unnamed protein product [Symbiodinium natans]|uniref:C3H1-type domain-containing protein n=1 Tax=Symbiodinium natans TaxID=878477 RepID=A0A812TSA5_9DINO|nr:unnamed protein product [Symbiodinium natans]